MTHIMSTIKAQHSCDKKLVAFQRDSFAHFDTLTTTENIKMAMEISPATIRRRLRFIVHTVMPIQLHNYVTMNNYYNERITIAEQCTKDCS